MAKGNDKRHPNGSALGFEAQLWATADKMCWQMGDVAVYGQESKDTTWKLARMNLAIRGFSLSASNRERVGVRCRIPRNADSFRQDLHPNLKVDFTLANPPFNRSTLGGDRLREDEPLGLYLSYPAWEDAGTKRRREMNGNPKYQCAEKSRILGRTSRMTSSRRK